MANFQVYKSCYIKNRGVSNEHIAALLKSSILKYYDDSSISITPNGMKVQGNLSAIFERAITSADAHFYVSNNELCFRVTGTSSLGGWPWVWFFLGLFTGFFLGVFLFQLVFFLVGRDRPRQCFEEAFSAVQFELSQNGNSNMINTGAHWLVMGSDNVQYGPYPENIMRQYFSEGKIQPSTMVWAQGMQNWQTFGEVFNVALPAPPAAPIKTQAPSSLRNKIFSLIGLIWGGLVLTRWILSDETNIGFGGNLAVLVGFIMVIAGFRGLFLSK